MRGEEMLHVCYAISDEKGGYAKYVGTSLESVLSHTAHPVYCHLLHDDILRDADKKRFERLTASYGGRAALRFYEIPALYGDRLARAYALLDDRWLAWYSPAVLYRFFLWDILQRENIEKAVYLDGDVLAVGDIGELFQEPVGASGLAAVPDIEVQQTPEKFALVREGVFTAARYFNSGVLLMEPTAVLRAIDSDWFARVLAFFRQYPQADFPDQDVLNFFFSKTYHVLPYRYNTIVGWERHAGREAEDALLCHFSGHAIGLDLTDSFNRRFFASFLQTPWCDVEFMEKLTALLGTVYDKRTRDMERLSNQLAGKRRVFVAESAYVSYVRACFHIQAGEELIPCDDVLSAAGDFAQAMASLRETHGFLFFSRQYPLLRVSLEKKGLQEGADFDDGRRYLPQKLGGYVLDSYAAFRRL